MKVYEGKREELWQDDKQVRQIETMKQKTATPFEWKLFFKKKVVQDTGAKKRALTSDKIESYVDQSNMT